MESHVVVSSKNKAVYDFKILEMPERVVCFRNGKPFKSYTGDEAIYLLARRCAQLEANVKTLNPRSQGGD